MKKNNQKIRGFTLIEILLYLSLFVVVVLGSVAFIHTMFETNVKTKVILEADNEAEHALAIIAQYVRNGVVIFSPNKNQTGDILIMQSLDESQSPILFGIIDDSIVMSTGGLSTTTLTSANIKVSNLKFTNAGSVNGKDSIKISFKVNTQGENKRQEYTYEKTYEATASLRN